MTSTTTEDCGCEPGVSRRSFLKGAGALGAAAAVSPMLSRRVAFAAEGTPPGDTLVVLSLRGGFDGLSAIAPIGDVDYLRARPTLAVPAASAIRLDTLFALHPNLAPLKRFWDAGQFGAVHAVGSPFDTRSHFQAQEEIERAAPGSTLRDGYLNRVLGGWGAGSSLRSAQVGKPVMPQSQIGTTPVMGITKLADVHLTGDDWTNGRIRTALAGLRSGVTGPAARSASLALAAYTQANALQRSGYTPAVAYPATDLGTALKDTAQLIKSNVGARLVTIDFGDWDFHSNQGAAGQGRFGAMLASLGTALAAFAADLGPALARTSLVAFSEFGRRVAENASGGTDHGHGGVMLLLGGGIVGGRVHTRWPTLAPGALQDGDLRGTVDYRDVLGEILVRRCGVSSLSTVFPGHTPAFLGLARAG